jgi:uncharacterized protein YdgA (DUF945 family)
MAPPGTSLMGNGKAMKLRLLALSATAALALAACNSSNQDAVNNAELNQPAVELNDLSTDAANDANAEAAALGEQQNQLESENAAAPDNTTNPSDEQEQNVSGM